MQPFKDLLNHLATGAVGAASLSCSLAASALPESELDRLGGRIEASIGGATYLLPSLSTDIDANVQGDLVTVTVKQRFDNPFDRPMHATYLFPLNKDAAVFEMVLEVADERIRAQIDRVEKAKQTFDAAKSKGKSAALLTQQRPNMFTQSIANLAPGVPVDVTLRYVHTVAKVDGEYELALPLVVGPRYQPPGAGSPASEEDSRTATAESYERFDAPEEAHLVHAGAEHAVGPELAGIDVLGAGHFGTSRLRGGAFIRVNAAAPGARATAQWRVEGPVAQPHFARGQYAQRTGNAADGPSSSSPFSRFELEGLSSYPPVSGLELPSSISDERVDLRVSLNAAVPLQAAQSPTHAVSLDEREPTSWSVRLARGRTIDNADFVLRYSLAGDRTQAGALTHGDERGGFFSMLIEPPAVSAQSEITPRELVFVLDASGSMSGLPMEASKAFMREALKNLRPSDSFRIIRFSDAATQFSTEPLPASPLNIVRAIRYTNALNGSGGTEMTSGIRQALDVPVPAGTLRLVVFLTDGYIGNDAEVLELIDERIGNARLFAFGVGASVNRYLLSQMGRTGRGFTRYMDPTERVDEVAKELAARIQSPVLTDIDIDWGTLDVNGVYPKRLPDLFGGQSLRIQGRTRSQGTHAVVVRGLVNGREASMPVRVDMQATSKRSDAIALVWARSAIAEAMYELTAARADARKQDELKQAVTQLGLDFSLVTQWTAFVAVSENIYNASPDGTPTRPVPLSKVKGVRTAAYGERAPFKGHAAPEPPALLAMALLATLGAVACRRGLRADASRRFRQRRRRRARLRG